MSGRLPDHVDFLRLARQGQRLHGELSQSRMPRLGSLLQDDRGRVRAEFAFALDDERRPVLRVRIETELVVECQRCLERFSLPVRAETVFGLIEHEAQAAGLPDDHEPLLLADRPMSPLELVEDELILALPVVARHERDDPACRPPAAAGTSQRTDTTADGRRNPFAVLNRLKK